MRDAPSAGRSWALRRDPLPRGVLQNAVGVALVILAAAIGTALVLLAAALFIQALR